MTHIAYQTSSARIRGVTLVDLLVSLTIIAITLGAGIPSLHKWLQKSAEDTAFKMLFHLSAYTRTEAIKTNDYFTLCPSQNQVSCGGPWNKQLIIFNDSNKNEFLDDEETLFKLISLPNSTPCIQWNLPERQYVQFKPTGMINGTAGHFRFCDGEDTLTALKLVISFNGRTSLRSL
jgi:type IV fimbrial biogenesis protein FimT